jgi:hypothetical protein
VKLLAPALVALLSLAACGGGDTAPSEATTPAATPTAAEPAPAKGGEEKHHGKLSPELDAFHEILAPRWHSEAGPARMKDTCAAIADFRTRGEAVKAAAAPANAAADAWSAAGAKLVSSVATLETTCAGTDQAAFDTAFSAVHDAFHHAMELGSGGHGEHHH